MSLQTGLAEEMLPPVSLSGKSWIRTSVTYSMTGSCTWRWQTTPFLLVMQTISLQWLLHKIKKKNRENLIKWCYELAVHGLLVGSTWLKLCDGENWDSLAYQLAHPNNSRHECREKEVIVTKTTMKYFRMHLWSNWRNEINLLDAEKYAVKKAPKMTTTPCRLTAKWSSPRLERGNSLWRSCMLYSCTVVRCEQSHWI